MLHNETEPVLERRSNSMPVSTDPTLDSLKLWKAYLLVFISSSSGLIIELVASRLIAPYLGSSIYTWTSVIGVTLGGISLGNWLGGRLADRVASFGLLRRLYYLGGFTSLAIVPMIIPVMGSGFIVGLNTQLRVLVSTLILFFLPSTLFGTISPVVIKLTLNDLATAGNKIGSVYAVSTLGSIFGTFTTGFLLISIFGTTLIVWGVAAAMVATSLVFCTIFIGTKRYWNRQTLLEMGIVLGLFLVFSTLLITSGALRGICMVESEYYCIRIYDGLAQDGRPAKALALDHLIHNFIVPENTSKGGYGYEAVYADLAAWMQKQGDNIDLLVVGAGAFSFPRFIRANYQASTVDAIEIDPEVVEVTHQYLGLKRDTDIHIFTEDARTFLNRNDISSKYSLVQGDVFKDVGGIPYHLTTYEFNQRVKASMKPNGLYMVTVVESGTSGHYLRAYIQTLRKSFKTVLLYEPGDVLNSATRSTFVVTATNRPLAEAPSSGWRLVPETELNAYLSKERPLILTDDFAPVDNLLLPVVETAIETNH